MPTQLESPYIIVYNTTTTYYVVCIYIYMYTHTHNIPYIIHNTT